MYKDKLYYFISTEQRTAKTKKNTKVYIRRMSSLKDTIPEDTNYINKKIITNKNSENLEPVGDNTSNKEGTGNKTNKARKVNNSKVSVQQIKSILKDKQREKQSIKKELKFKLSTFIKPGSIHINAFKGLSLTKLLKVSFNFLPKVTMMIKELVIYEKFRQSKTRQQYRTGVFMILYLNNIIVLGLYFWFYKISINFSYVPFIFLALVLYIILGNNYWRFRSDNILYSYYSLIFTKANNYIQNKYKS